MSTSTQSSTPESASPSRLSSPALSDASSPDSSRPPSPLLRPLPKHLPANSKHGLATRPPFGLNALSGASFGFTTISSKKDNDDPPRTASPDTLEQPEEEAVADAEGPAVTDTGKPKPRRRTSSVAMAPFITKFEPYEPEEYVVCGKSGTKSPARFEKVAIVGSGSWGTALARVAATNTAEQEGFDPEVRMWVREQEIHNGKRLIDIINEGSHQNEKYLPDVDLPENLIAVPSLVETVRNASLILFVVPHQFLPAALKELKASGVVNSKARAISAIKGVDVVIEKDAGGKTTQADIYTFPSVIEKELGIPCTALGGANIALDVGRGEFCETTIGVPSAKDAALWHAVFDGPNFRVHPIEDVAGVSLSGALKNIVALAAGFVDGMGLGGNTKAAILRVGLLEMAMFTQDFFPGSSSFTFSHHSAGMADLITTSFGGRNRKCAEAFIKSKSEYAPAGTVTNGKGKTFLELEEVLLNGQKLQGTLTAQEVFDFLEARGRLEAYPLFEKVYRISFEGMDPKRLFEDLWMMTSPMLYGCFV